MVATVSMIAVGCCCAVYTVASLWWCSVLAVGLRCACDIRCGRSAARTWWDWLDFWCRVNRWWQAVGVCCAVVVITAMVVHPSVVVCAGAAGLLVSSGLLLVVRSWCFQCAEDIVTGHKCHCPRYGLSGYLRL